MVQGTAGIENRTSVILMTNFTIQGLMLLTCFHMKLNFPYDVLEADAGQFSNIQWIGISILSWKINL